ncbi:MAG: hypothetical protein R2856_04835 [Caldilineaceae bacterium]
MVSNNEFVVSRRQKEGRCRIYAQRVTDTASRTDRLLLSGTLHYHSPSLVYNSAQQRYVLAYVAGDDYLPPSFLGTTTDDCGNNAASTSGAQAVDFYFNGDTVITGDIVNVSGCESGRLPTSSRLQSGTEPISGCMGRSTQRSGQAYRFDVYAQRPAPIYSLRAITSLWLPATITQSGHFRYMDTAPCNRRRRRAIPGYMVSTAPSDSAVTWSVTARSISTTAHWGRPSLWCRCLLRSLMRSIANWLSSNHLCR